MPNPTCCGLAMIDRTKRNGQRGLRVWRCARCLRVSEEAVRIEECDSEGEPTHHPPGSEGKIAVMAERLRLRQPLFHRLDSTADTPADRLGPRNGAGPRLGPMAGAGVRRHRRKWIARIWSQAENVWRHLGSFGTYEEAVAVACRAREEGIPPRKRPGRKKVDCRSGKEAA